MLRALRLKAVSMDLRRKKIKLRHLPGENIATKKDDLGNIVAEGEETC